MARESGGDKGDDRPDTENIVKNAIGNSVTPSRLHTPVNIGIVRKILGYKPVEGSFTTYLRTGEQPHYIFHTTNGLFFPKVEDDCHQDHFTFREMSYVSPCVGMVTDQRTSFIIGDGDTRQIISMEHADVENVDHRDLKIEKGLTLYSPQRQLSFSMWTTDPHPCLGQSLLLRENVSTAVRIRLLG